MRQFQTKYAQTTLLAVSIYRHTLTICRKSMGKHVAHPLGLENELSGLKYADLYVRLLNNVDILMFLPIPASCYGSISICYIMTSK